MTLIRFISTASVLKRRQHQSFNNIFVFSQCFHVGCFLPQRQRVQVQKAKLSIALFLRVAYNFHPLNWPREKFPDQGLYILELAKRGEAPCGKHFLMLMHQEKAQEMCKYQWLLSTVT